MDLFRREVLERTHLEAHKKRIKIARQKILDFRPHAQPAPTQGAAANPAPAAPDDQVAILDHCTALVKGNLFFQRVFESIEQLDALAAIRPIDICFMGLLVLAINQLEKQTPQCVEGYTRTLEMKPLFTSSVRRRLINAAPQKAKHSLLVGNTRPRKSSPLKQTTGVNDDDSWDVPAKNENNSWEDYINWDADEPSKG